jgi:large subunit ribosomal protein L31
MREKIHPNWFPNAKITCAACGTVFTIGATRPTLQVDICSTCHPFYTGEQRIVDTEGRVDRFMKRLEVRTTASPTDTKASGPQDFPLTELGLGRQYTELLANNGMVNATDVVRRLQEGGDESIIDIRGVGRKVLTDITKKLRARGFELPLAQA